MFNDAMELRCVDVMYSSGPYWAFSFFRLQGFRDEHMCSTSRSTHYFYSLVKIPETCICLHRDQLG